jgi:predicted regulator of Ras-like GTPase activity (Roadblock/LC7/MglB family)
MDQHLAPEDWDRHFRAIWVQLQRLLDRSGAATAILLDISGNAVTYAGEDPEFDLSTFASLAVGDYVATQELASLLDQGNSRWVVHQGVKGGMLLVPLHPLLVLGVLFDGRTTLGLVRHQIRKDRDRVIAALGPLISLLERQLAADAALDDMEQDEVAAAAAGWGSSLDPADQLIEEGLERLFNAEV